MLSMMIGILSRLWMSMTKEFIINVHIVGLFDVNYLTYLLDQACLSIWIEAYS